MRGQTEALDAAADELLPLYDQLIASDAEVARIATEKAAAVVCAYLDALDPDEVGTNVYERSDLRAVLRAIRPEGQTGDGTT